MNDKLRWVSAVTAVLLAAALCAGDDTRSPFEVRQSDEGVLILEAGKRVLFYQRRPRSLAGEYERAHYIHPLYGLSGEILSEDFPRDHLHHHGIFTAWHQLIVGGKKLGDPWMSQDFRWDVRDVKVAPVDASSTALRTVVEWKSPLWRDPSGVEKALVRENMTVRVHRIADRKRKIDFEISLTALEDDVRLGGSDDEKGYGGFSPRFFLPSDVKFTGRRGVVKPENTAVDAGPWVDLSGSFGGGRRVSGVAILSHPTLPAFPPPWILRERGSMQNPVYPGRQPVVLPRGKPVVLRYRLVIHEGDAAEAGIDRMQREYESEAY